MSEFCVYANFHSPNRKVRRENFNKFSKAVGGAINDKDLCVENVACGCFISKKLKLLLVASKSLFTFPVLNIRNLWKSWSRNNA